MTTYEEQIDKVRSYFEEHKAERYPFENTALREKDEYTKSLYFRMLCTLIRYTGEPNEMQELYVRRLIAGTNAENEFHDYMRMALDLDAKDVSEFVSVFQEDDVRYYFCIDGSILLTVAEASDKNYQLLAELIELLGITRNELVYLSAAVKAIVMQNSEMFEEARKLASGKVQSLSLFQYVHGFCHSSFVDETPDKMHIYSYDKAKFDLSQYGTLEKKKVMIENVVIELQGDVTFDGCDEVIFKNCKVVIDQHRLSIMNSAKHVIFENSIFEGGTKEPIMFKNCADIQIKSCVFRNFTSRTIQLEVVAGFKVEDTAFENCMYQYSSNEGSCYTDIGGVICSSNNAANATNYYQGCSFINCGSRNLKDIQHTACISNCKSVVKSCVFKNCWNYYGGFETKSQRSFDMRRMFWGETLEEECEVVNSARII